MANNVNGINQSTNVYTTRSIRRIRQNSTVSGSNLQTSGNQRNVYAADDRSAEEPESDQSGRNHLTYMQQIASMSNCGSDHCQPEHLQSEQLSNSSDDQSDRFAGFLHGGAESVYVHTDKGMF